MKTPVILALMALSIPVFAEVSSTVTPGTYVLKSNSTTYASGLADRQACVDAARARNITATYQCVLTDTVSVTVSSNPPPPPDTDGDGLPDSIDVCPTVAANTPNGCPAPTPPPVGAYSTGFDLTENPISENGMWVQHGGTTGVSWTNIQTANGLAFGTQTSFDGYDDSIALLSGFGPDQKVTLTVHRNMAAGRSGTHEVQAILRGTYAPRSQKLYECNLGYSGTGFYVQIIRQNGPPGGFTSIGNALVYNLTFQDGDQFSCEIRGNKITAKLNGVAVSVATDSTYTTGQPGIGAFWRGTENRQDLAIDAVVVESL